MKIKHGNYKVVRFCCISANCFECRAVGNKDKRKLVVQIDRLSKKTALQVAANYSLYGAIVSPMAVSR